MTCQEIGYNRKRIELLQLLVEATVLDIKEAMKWILVGRGNTSCNDRGRDKKREKGWSDHDDINNKNNNSNNVNKNKNINNND